MKHSYSLRLEADILPRLLKGIQARPIGKVSFHSLVQAQKQDRHKQSVSLRHECPMITCVTGMLRFPFDIISPSFENMVRILSYLSSKKVTLLFNISSLRNHACTVSKNRRAFVCRNT